MKILDVIATILLIVGGLNWGLVGLFEFDLVAFIAGGLEFGEANAFSRFIYVVVGLAAVYLAVSSATVPQRWGRRLPAHV